MISYADIKQKQAQDLQSGKIVYSIYRRISTPFTYIFVKINASPDSITIANFLSPIIGFFFLALGTYKSMIIGLLFFVLYQILDMSDGEVARIQNPNALTGKRNWEGAYFDTAGHFIETIFLGMGLGISLVYSYNSQAGIIFGTLLAAVLTMEFALPELVKSYLRRSIIEKKISLKENLKSLQKSVIKKIMGRGSWSDQNIFLKIFGVYPFEGLIFTREFIAPIVIVLASMEYFLFRGSQGMIIYGNSFGISSIYILAVFIVKSAKIARFIIRIKNDSPISSFLDVQK